MPPLNDDDGDAHILQSMSEYMSKMQILAVLPLWVEMQATTDAGIWSTK